MIVLVSVGANGGQGLTIFSTQCATLMSYWPARVSTVRLCSQAGPSVVLSFGSMSKGMRIGPPDSSWWMAE